MNITYHLVPKAYFEAQNPDVGYLPARFAEEGFIHCTDGELMLSRKAVQYYAQLQDELLILFIDRAKLSAPVRYDDPEHLFPHIYGPVNRDAIVKVSRMVRDRKGEWIFPIQEKATV